ncbi:MAG: LLM class flavin-dependent oxidoreductase [Actinomycetota bacterium]
MRFGLALPQYGYSLTGGVAGGLNWLRLRDWAQQAEDLGFSSVWLSDHLFLDLAKYGGSEQRYDAMECLTTLAALATSTSRVRLGSLVLCNDLRSAALVGKMASTLGDLAGRGIELGIGAGWYEPEYEAAGIDFDPAPARITRLGESLKVIKEMLPSGVRLWVGGKGDRMVRLAARLADGYNSVWAWTPEAFGDRVALLDRSSERNVARSVGLYTLCGRNDTEIEQRWQRYRDATSLGATSLDINQTAADWGADKLFGTPAQVVTRVNKFKALGVEEVILGFGILPFQIADPSAIEMFAREVFPLI